MRRVEFLLVLMLILCGWLYAQPQITVSCTPSEIFVNSLSASSFDPINPSNQPILTYVNFQNNLGFNCLFNVQVRINWNETKLVDVNLNSKESHPLLPGPNLYTNRDLVNNSASDFFYAPSGEVTISGIMEANTVLRDALQSGYFPDGVLTFIFTVKPTTSLDGTPVPNAESSSGSFTITIKNINSIFLSYPGKPIGQTPPDVNIRPVTFLWNSVSSYNNEFRLNIREFVPGNPPNINSVETGGKKVYNEVVRNNMFTGFLPFQDNHYYAWQISTGLYTETSPEIISKDETNGNDRIKSDWYVFKFVSDTDAMNDNYSQLRAILNSLNNQTIQDAFTQGFDVTGAVFYEGQVYTGKDAVDLAKTLLGKEIEVELQDN